MGSHIEVSSNVDNGVKVNYVYYTAGMFDVKWKIYYFFATKPARHKGWIADPPSVGTGFADSTDYADFEVMCRKDVSLITLVEVILADWNRRQSYGLHAEKNDKNKPRIETDLHGLLTAEIAAP